MGMPALRFEPVATPEERLFVVETHIDHIRADVADLKIETRELRRDMQLGFTALRQDMHELRNEMRGEMSGLRDETHSEFSALRAEISSAKIWALGLYAAQTISIFGVMARALGWI